MSEMNILDRCTSFELRGPAHASLSEVKGGQTIVHRAETDWAKVTGGKPVADNRTSDLLDLYPRPRSVLEAMGRLMENSPEPQSPKPRLMR